MRGYPKFVATRQDYLNLLADDELRERARADLQAIYDLEDNVVTQATTPVDPDDPEKGFNITEIDNPMPMWKQKGFAGREEILEILG